MLIKYTFIYRDVQTATGPAPAYDADVSKLVSAGHGIVVQQTGCCDPARMCVVSKDDQLVLIASVTNPEQTLLHVGYDDALTNRMNASHQARNMLDTEQGGEHLVPSAGTKNMTFSGQGKY